MKDLISVIIPAYNAEKYIEETLNSVLSQTGYSLEVILVDDGSTDNTIKVVEPYLDSIKYKYQQNAGQVSALNFGISEARGDFITFVDADDLWAKSKLSVLLTPMLKDNHVMASMGNIQRFFIRDGKTEFLPKEYAMSFLAGLYRKELFREVGKIDENLSAHYDIDWHMRLKDSDFKTAYIDKVVGYYRRHEKNMSSHSNVKSANEAMIALLKKSLKRKADQ